MRDDSSRGFALVVGATFFWSLSGMFARWLPAVDPWTFNAIRGLGMSVSLLVWTLAHYRLGAVKLVTGSNPVALLIAAGFFAVGSTLYIVALQYSSVAAVSCIGATSGIFAALMARTWLGERTSAAVVLAIGLAIAGVLVIAMGEASMSLGGLTGTAVALGFALCFAGQSVALRRYSALNMEPAMILGGLGVYLAVRYSVGLAPVGIGTWLVLLLMGVLQLAVPMVLYMRGARHVAAVQMVLITMADAVLNPLWVWLVHGELPARAVYWGGAIILLAIAVSTWPSLMAARKRA